jgi:hypothetical protein
LTLSRKSNNSPPDHEQVLFMASSRQGHDTISYGVGIKT